MALCPQCDTAVEIDDTMEEGETIDCPECGATLELVNTNPVELDVVGDDGDEEETETW